MIIFGFRSTFLVAPVTATVMAPSGINAVLGPSQAFSAVALFPVIAGLTGLRFYDPAVANEFGSYLYWRCRGALPGGWVGGSPTAGCIFMGKTKGSPATVFGSPKWRMSSGSPCNRV